MYFLNHAVGFAGLCLNPVPHLKQYVSPSCVSHNEFRFITRQHRAQVMRLTHLISIQGLRSPRVYPRTALAFRSLRPASPFRPLARTADAQCNAFAHHDADNIAAHDRRAAPHTRASALGFHGAVMGAVTGAVTGRFL